MARFTVDTHLFRELGTYLVARDSTALIELLKNSYDADATSVLVLGEDLSDVGGRITITDNGNGMTPAIFETGFLRIASRIKETDERRSPIFGRRFTGAKGLGRLAAHKLSSVLEVRSIPRPDAHGAVRGLRGVAARIDWNAVEEHATLDDVGDSVQVEPLSKSGSKHGSALMLAPLRRPFDEVELATFVADVTTFAPPSLLSEPLPKAVVDATVLFEAPRIRDTNRDDPGMSLTFAGDLDVGESHWLLLAERMHWILEIRCSARRRVVEYVVAPTVAGRQRHPRAESQRFQLSHPLPGVGPGFDARILISETGRYGRDLSSDFVRRTTGIRVYMEGFRVLPYGSPDDDWLELNASYTQRRRPFDLSGLVGDIEDPITGESFYRLNTRNYVGAVYVTEAASGGLQMLINREGFLPGPELSTLRDLVRQGIELTARVRAAVTQAERSAAPGERRSARATERADGVGQPDAVTTASRVALALETLSDAVETVEQRLPSDAAGPLREAIDDATDELSRLRRDQAIFRTLATLGTQFSAYVHETNMLLVQARVVQEVAHRLRGNSPELIELRDAADEMVASLERHASFLTDQIGADARRVRRPLDPEERLNSALRLVGSALQRRHIELIRDLPRAARTPPMFPTELTAIFTNALTNAVKAAGEHGRIRVAGKALRGRGGFELIVENTGDAVDLEDAERWFQPFESTTADIDELLGQGLGLGLPLIRRLVAEYGGEARFIEPTDGYATALYVRIPRSSRV